MTTSGIVTGVSNAPLPGITVTVMNNNGSGQMLAPGLSDVTDSGGNFYIENIPDGTTQDQAFVSFHDPSGTYLDAIWQLSEDEGTVQMEKAVKSITDIPIWVWILVGAVVLYFGWVGYKKGYFNKLFK